MIDKTIAHYKILEKLGEGGMGVVYKARDTKLDRIVALKFLPPHIAEGETENARLVQEAKAAAALNHPNACSVIDLQEVDDQQFIVMEYVDGVTLRKKIPVNLKDAISYACQIADALSEAHSKGIVHRDIKSENIMVNSRGQIKVMDFGLARLKGSIRLTRTRSTVGTLAYMAPEQMQGSDGDERADVFSLGVVLYEMISGRMPFRGEHDAAVMYSVLNEEPESIQKYVPDASPFLSHILERALQKDPGNRYQSVGEFLADLHTLQDERSGERMSAAIHPIPEKGEPLPTRLKGKWAYLAAGILVVLVAVVLFVPGRKLLQRWLGTVDVPEQQHLLILPLDNVGGVANGQALCDGIVETMTSKLTQLEQFNRLLWVVPASETRKSKIQSPSDAHRYFGVNLAVTGSLQQLGETFRLTLNLVDAEHLRQLNSAVIDVSAANLSALQNECVSKLLTMLNTELNPTLRKVLEEGAPAVPAAYEFYLRGVGYLQRFEDESNIDAAIRVFKQAIAMDSLYALAHAGLSQAYWWKYDAGKETRYVSLAIEEGETAYRLNNRLPQVNITQGMIYAGTGEHDKALAAFNRATEVDPTNAAAYGGLAKEYEAKGMLQEAEATYQKAIALKPDYWAGYNNLGVFYFRHGRYEDAIRQFQQVVSLTPDNDRGYTNLGGICYMLKRWKEAREMFERSLSIRKTYLACSNLGTLYYIEGNNAKAAQMYKAALELNDKDFRVWGNLAAAYYWTPDQKPLSDDAYRHAIELAEEQRKVNPKDPELLSLLAGYYSMVGEREKTVSLVKQAVDLAPEDAEIMYRTAAAYEELGDRDQALVWIGKALKHGYPLSEIEHQPELRELRADKRFQKMIHEAGGVSGK